jgi:Concanavalin A-like lectin/glucanases superfamily
LVSTPLTLPSQGTIALWVKPFSITDTHGIVGTFGDNNGDNRLWITATGDNGGPGVGPNRVAVNLGSRFVNDLDIPSPFTGTSWVHLALTFDYISHNYTIYVNGQAIQTSTAVRTEPSHPLDFGGERSNFLQNFFWNGLIDEVYVFDQVLTSSEIQDLARPVIPSNRCPLDKDFWKNHTGAWPVTTLTLGSQTYTQAQLLTILTAPVRGDASLILADQLIAAKLNIANGSNLAPISSTITDADRLLSQFGTNKLPYNVRASSAIGQQMVNDANVLDRYNNGDLTPNCTP